MAAPSNGNVTCSNGNVYKSECTFSCGEGYYLDGNKQTECAGDFKWNNIAPRCQRSKTILTYIISP